MPGASLPETPGFENLEMNLLQGKAPDTGPDARASGSDLVKVGYFDYGGFLEKDGNGGYSGYGYEYLQEIANYTGWRYQFVYGDWETCVRRLEEGEIDLLCTMQRSPEREQRFDFARYESGTEYAALFVSKNNGEVFYEDFASFDGLAVGFMADSYQNGLFQQYALEHGFSYTSVVYPSALEMTRALDRGEVDAMLTGSLQKIEGEKVVAKFSPDPFYFTTTKGNTRVLDGVNMAMEQIRTADVNFNAKLYDKYYGASVSSQIAFTRQEAEYIKNHPRLTATFAMEWAPVQYWDTESRSYQGISAGLLELLSQRCGIQFDFVRPGGEERPDLICGLPREQVHESQKDAIYLTKPYFEIPVSLARRSEEAMKPVERLAVPSSLLGLARTADGLENTGEFTGLPELDSCLKAVSQGKADAAFDNTYLLDQYLKDSRYQELETVALAEKSYPICIGVSREQDLALLSLLNKCITQISEAEIESAVLSNTMQGPQVRFSQLMERFGLPIFLGVLLLAVLALLKYKKILEKYAFYDPLTGCKNQTRFVMEANRLIRGKNYSRYAVMCLDINQFKVLNDINGFEAGNRVLRAVGDAIGNRVRQDEIYCRASSDHFYQLLSCQDGGELESKCQAIVNDVCSLHQTLGKNLQFTVSCGVYRIDEPLDNIHTAIDRANLARQSMKKSHHTQIAYYDVSMREEALREQEIENNMEPAMRDEEFIVYYQPKYSLSCQNVVGAEALVRWRKPSGTIVPPDEFIPVFETNGFIIKLDLYVFRRVCQDLKEWMDQGKYPFPVSVNLSRAHLYQPNFYEQYLEIMDQYRIPAYLIELELTETVIFDNQAQLIRIMNQLKEKGLSISMDDFGSGYSSLNLLKDMPIDFLKIDREFLNSTSDTERGKKIIASVVSMAKQLDISVVSEGVETKEQAEFLRNIHCDIAQGYYFSRPVPKEEFERLAFQDKTGLPVLF